MKETIKRLCTVDDSVLLKYVLSLTGCIVNLLIIYALVQFELVKSTLVTILIMSLMFYIYIEISYRIGRRDERKLHEW